MEEHVYRLEDIIDLRYIRLPLMLFGNPRYAGLSSDAKLAYALLLDRLSLSQRNGWVNDAGEVYLIYTREKIADMLCVSYKKAMAAFRELVQAGLIREERVSRTAPKHIYLCKLATDQEHAANCSSGRSQAEPTPKPQIPGAELTHETGRPSIDDLPNGNLTNDQFGRSRTTGFVFRDMPDWDINPTELNITEDKPTEVSLSVRQSADDGMLGRILANCELESFTAEEAEVLRLAIERLYFMPMYRIGGAVLPQQTVRSHLCLLDSLKVRDALEKLRHNTRPVKNSMAYIMAVIYNSVGELYGDMLVDPYLNQLTSAGYKGGGTRCGTYPTHGRNASCAY